MINKVNIYWFRRDLRLNDNAALYHALKDKNKVLPIFIFDKNILSILSPSDARLNFIHSSLKNIKQELNILKSDLSAHYGKPLDVWQKLINDYNIETVFANHDYEPYAMERDEKINTFLAKHNIKFKTFKDHVIFEKNEVVKNDGLPYTVFTPYSKKWKQKLESKFFAPQSQLESREKLSFYFKSYPTEKYFSNLIQTSPSIFPTLKTLGFQESDKTIPSPLVARKVVMNYDKTRDFPILDGTTKLGIHFRHGTISIREKARNAQLLNETFLNELIWRDFYSQILFHFPHVAKEPFRKKYDFVQWINNPQDFEKWCEGMTGYPLVDAGMRELNATGLMHNRVRMVVASFLTKHLLIDWRLGEAYFAERLLDFDLASNNGGWQWAAGCGTDAAPYFRIFNPTSQQKKFDKEFKYIKKWIPEYGTQKYPEPIVEHKFARQRALDTYKEGLNKKGI